MNPQAAQNYFRTRVLTATPEQLQMMLFDGIVRFGDQAKAALEQKNWEVSYKMISRMQAILVELTGSLKHEVDPHLCKQLAGLYNFAYRKLIDASVHHKVESLDEAMQVLRFQRETWSMLLNQLAQKKAAIAANKLDMPAPDRRMEASISMQG